jgi:hypothetical protein
MKSYLPFLTLASLFWGLWGCTDDEPKQPLDHVTYTEQRQQCADRNPYRNLYFGDTHVHTRLSWDAYGYALRVTPRESYAFAQGGEVALPPLDSAGKGTRKTRLGAPLDFAAITDHAEFLGEVHICQTPGTAGYDSQTCKDFRKGGAAEVRAWGTRLINEAGSKRHADACGADGQACLAAAAKVWASMQQAAEEAYDRSSRCKFVSFVGYEYTATPVVTNTHRNVIYRNKHVTKLPISYYEQPHPWGLWKELAAQCLDAGSGCEALSIPHNSNWSNGRLFHPEKSRPTPAVSLKEALALRARLEPLVEIAQHKGDMECSNGLSGTTKNDPLCDFEKLRFPPFKDCGDGVEWGGVQDFGCISKLDFMRGIMIEGLELDRRLGLNPYMMGVIGSTDTHNGTPGNTDERSWPGHVGNADDTPEERLGLGNYTHRGRVNNPGGLAAVWAVERSRDAIFEAMRRREVYSTTGTRISLRLFGGWDLSADPCADADWLKQAYEDGVPMGGVLPKRRGSGGPRFLVRADMDPGDSKRAGTPLQMLQIIKGWVDSAGAAREKVYTVAGSAQNGASVDVSSCKTTSGSGKKTLCAVWRDPEFSPENRAFYYARALENPTCRWTTWLCNTFAPAKRPEGCSDPNIEKAIQERAVSTPIWYQPE